MCFTIPNKCRDFKLTSGVENHNSLDKTVENSFPGISFTLCWNFIFFGGFTMVRVSSPHTKILIHYDDMDE